MMREKLAKGLASGLPRQAKRGKVVRSEERGKRRSEANAKGP